MSACGCDQIKGQMLCYDEAVAQLLSAAQPITETERLPTAAALGRVLAQPVTSAIDVPAWDNSAMDGYAVCFSDLTHPGVQLPISQRIPAGRAGQALTRGTAARIFTGAPIPPGADTVVIQENCLQQNGSVYIAELPKRAGANVRYRGEDVVHGKEIIATGTKLLPQHLGLAASVGIGELSVFRRLRVALFASGDELVMPGQPLGPGQIYNSNQFTATALLQALDCDVIHLGIVEDTLEATCEALAKGAAGADLIIASGGVSVGEEDHVKPAVERLGSLQLWKVAIRPGKPIAFGHIGKTPFIGTPGNPVSQFVTFLLFARPFILKMQGNQQLLPSPWMAEANFDWPLPDKRREYARARLEAGPDGKPRVSIFPSRSSAVLSSVTWANGLVVIHENHSVQRGDPVQFLSFGELLS